MSPDKIELHKEQKRLLKYIYKSSNGLGQHEYVDLTLAPKYITNNNQLDDYVRFLHKNDLIYVDGKTNTINGNYVYDLNFVKTTSRASEYFKWQSEHFRKFIYGSIIVPIGVAVATSLATTILIKIFTNLLSK